MSSSGIRKTIDWYTGSITVRVVIEENGTPCIESFYNAQPALQSPYFTTARIPLNGIRVAGQGQGLHKTAKSLVGSVLSERLRYLSHDEHRTPSRRNLDIVSIDDQTGLRVTHHFQVIDIGPVLRSWTTVQNVSKIPIRNAEKATQTLNQVSSLTIGGLTAGTQDWHSNYTVWTANNTWFRELQWQERTLPDVGIDEIGLHALSQGHKATMASFSLSNRGSLTTETHLPMGALTRKNGGDVWLWQIESGGSWRWEIGDWQDSLYLAAGGPTLVDHAWQLDLAPGQSFTSVPVAICHSRDLTQAFRSMEVYRRDLTRHHADHYTWPIIFNDYMNCLMGDPDEDKIKALIKPAAHCGAEYYVIDAGWYADEVDWWDDVGTWEPSTKRFPSGFKALIIAIQDAGLLPGLWLEPEVIGVRSIAAKELPNEAFFQEKGKRVEERRRYQLDFTHPAVRERMDRIVDRLVTEYMITYFKFDYNIEVMTGSDTHPGLSTGAAHLEHQRAYIKWIDDLLSRHEGLVVENCASGGQRMEYGLLTVCSIQSISDQQDPYLYAAIAASAPTAVALSQSASWAYPQPDWSDEKNVFTVVNSMMGRVHLSGRLDALSSHQLDLVREGMQVYRDILKYVAYSRVFWPLGLPGWHDDWVALGMDMQNQNVFLAVWRRSGPTSLSLPLPRRDHISRGKVLYPASLETSVNVLEEMVEIVVPDVPCARLLYLWDGDTMSTSDVTLGLRSSSDETESDEPGSEEPESDE